jgi:hypothetical protein
VDGTVIQTIIARRPATVALTGEEQGASLKMCARTLQTSSGSMTVLVSRHANGWQHKKVGKTRFAGGTMNLILSARAPAIAANTGVQRRKEMRIGDYLKSKPMKVKF